jgi:hypothetical protein
MFKSYFAKSVYLNVGNSRLKSHNLPVAKLTPEACTTKHYGFIIYEEMNRFHSKLVTFGSDKYTNLNKETH